MTVEEWANEIERQKRLVLDGPKTNYIHLIHSDKELERQIQIDVLRAAIEEEREACAKIAHVEAMKARALGLSQFENPALDIERQIRARTKE